MLRALALLICGMGAGVAHADLPATIARIKPSIVVVGYFKTTNNPRFSLRGTGFVVGDGNQVITNSHVLQTGAEADPGAELMVYVRAEGSAEGQLRRAESLEQDQRYDLALLRMEGNPVTALPVRDSATVREGQSVAFIGFPIGGALGFAPVTHRGTISSITPFVPPAPTGQQLNERAVRSLRAGAFNIFQLDGTAYPGNSGGPLFDPDTGDVLGVLNMVFVKGARESALTNPSGISYAIPGTFVNQLLQRQKK